MKLNRPAQPLLLPGGGLFPTKEQQDCLIQKEARVCVSNSFVMVDSQFKLCF